MKTLDEKATAAERIHFYRTKRNISCHTLAEITGVSRHTIMNYESNQSEPPLNDLKKIAVALKIEADKLFDGYYRFLDYPYSEKIKSIRVENNLLQRELGEMLGVNRRSVERWEHEKNGITRETWERLKELNLL